jgi:hypothetical protein
MLPWPNEKETELSSPLEITMHHHPKQPSMNQKIFSMNLDVETVSLYLLCCAVADAGAAITRSTLQEKWNGSGDALERELEKLLSRNILCRDDTTNGEEVTYRVEDERKWD